MSQERELAELVTEYAATKLEDHFAQVSRCARMLTGEQLWHRLNSNNNSVANLLLHLDGNIRQWVLGGLAGREVQRDRQAEFDARGGAEVEALLGELHETLREACGVIRGMEEEHLAWEFSIQAYRVSGAAAVMHVVEHFAFHTGQVVTMTKAMLDVDVSLYDENGHRRDGRSDEVP